ncbi:MAG: NfeD family protein [Spirochaetaceae bacterium]|jgi:membrane protein implicated in regulation of membrane protease activity|nr:NfeD family protein [Spirochaetaceae bacterium]
MLFDFGFVPVRWIWAVLVIIFALVEVFTFGLTTVWFALAALVMVFLSFLNISFPAQILIFLVLSAGFLIITRPLAVKKFKTGREKTNVDSLIGKHALVIKKIGEFEKGEVKLAGQIWAARSEDGAEIGEEVKCEVVRIEGVTAIVRPLAWNSGAP